MSVLKAGPVAQALRKHKGNMACVARQFGVTRSGVKRFVDARPSLREVLLECREAMKDTAESALYEAVAEGEAWAVQFYLRTQGRDRGYGDKAEIEHRGRVVLGVEQLSDDELSAIAAAGE
jgi:hypothetical protein